MSRSRLLVLLALGCLVGLPLLAGLPARAEDESATSRLLLRCPSDRVPDILTALAGLEVEVMDLETMEPLTVEKPAAPLADSAPVLGAVVDVLGRVNAGAAQPLVRLEEGVVYRDRVELTLLLVDPANVDLVAAAMDDNEVLRIRRIRESTTPQSLNVYRDGMWRTKLVLRLPVGDPTDGLPLEDAGRLQLGDIVRACLSVGVPLRGVSAARREAGAGRRALVTRSVTLGSTTGGGLLRLCEALSAHPAAVVTRVGWTVADPMRSNDDVSRALIEVTSGR